MTAPATVHRPDWPAQAASLGFARGAVEESLHRLGMSLTCEGSWATLCLDSDSLPCGEMGHPGLWKKGPNGVLCFDLPPVETASQEEGGLSALLDWAVTAADGHLPRGWKAPAAEELPFAAEQVGDVSPDGVEIVRRPDRFAVVAPLAGPVPKDISASRLALVEEIISDAGARWRLVRVGLVPDVERYQAEVDLTGVPETLAEPLFRLSLTALRTVVRWVRGSLETVLDPKVESNLIDTWTHAGMTRGKEAR